MTLPDGLRDVIRTVRKAARATPTVARQYLSVTHPRKRGSAGHLHARLTKGEYWKRRYIPILSAYARSGYSITISPSVEFLDSPRGEEFALWRSPWIRIAHAAPANSLILTDDRETVMALRQRGERAGLVAAEDHVTDWGPSAIALPYMMHPSLYSPEKMSYTDADAGADQRDIRVFFAGNFFPRDYDQDRLKAKYQVVTRLALGNLIDRYLGAETMWVRTWDEKKNLDDIQKPILIVDSYKAGLSSPEYFGLLGRSNFFLAMPGISTPFCHNLAEAMSRGCIPIIEEPRWFDAVPFEDGVNCILFGSADGFIPAIRRALDMDEESIVRLRAGVRKIWDEYYTPSSIVSRVNTVLAGTDGSLPVILVKPG